MTICLCNCCLHLYLGSTGGPSAELAGGSQREERVLLLFRLSLISLERLRSRFAFFSSVFFNSAAMIFEFLIAFFTSGPNSLAAAAGCFRATLVAFDCSGPVVTGSP